MGLGKSVQALIAVEAGDTYPVVIVCPASLRANWVNEGNKFLPSQISSHRFRQAGGPDSRDNSYLLQSLAPMAGSVPRP